MSQATGKTRKNSIKKEIAGQRESTGKNKTQRIEKPLNKRLYDLKEAAIYLGRPVFSVRTLIWNGALPVIKDGRKLYLDILDMDSYIERSKTTFI